VIVQRSTSAHSSRDFETELRELRAHLLAMGARCERAFALACESFLEGEAEVAQEVEALDVLVVTEPGGTAPAQQKRS